MDVNRFIELLESYLQNRAGEDEQQELYFMIASGKYDAEIIRRIDAGFEEEAHTNIHPQRAQEILQYIISKPAVTENGNSNGVHVIPIYKRNLFRWIAAACIILVMGYGLWVALGRRVQDTGDKTQVAKANDVAAPKETRAVITLANGQKVYLDSASNGTIAQENNVSVVKNEKGEIIYSHEGAKAQSEIAYNTLSNPRGSKVISLTLSDGTKVWLNSESSLKYPIAFNANTREVEITGEAYFEVKHNSRQPFKVHLPNGSLVEDIGTAFNVNAYSDEEDIKTTLIEGSVRVSANSQQLTANSLVLKPNQQAVLTRNLQLLTFNPNLDEVTAWKNGIFQFTNSNIESIMKQVARWYDVDVVYQGSIRQTFNGKIPRTVNASDLFKILESTGWVHFKIEGKRITVMQ